MITDNDLYEVLQLRIDDAINQVLFGMSSTEMTLAAFNRDTSAYTGVRDCLSIQALRVINDIETECATAFTDVGIRAKSFDDLIFKMVTIARDVALKHKPDDLKIWDEDDSNE